ncbi:IS91 family transposase, partial [Hafnia paralvei]
MVGVIKNIFIDNWDEFEVLNRGNIRSIVYREIKRMLNCGSLDIGYIEFKCEACGEIKKVGFRCKSRFCTSCGKKKSEDWADEMTSKLVRSKHRHMVFTIPKEIRNYFGKNRKLLALLPQCAAKA